MGCGNSSDGKPDKDGQTSSRPKVSIRVGNHVERSPNKEETQIVFVFGKDINVIVIILVYRWLIKNKIRTQCATIAC